MDSSHDPYPTIEAILNTPKPGSSKARLVIIAGPPGVGKSELGRRLVKRLPESILLDKDHTAGKFILEAASTRGEYYR